jgi:hypothetical protein
LHHCALQSHHVDLEGKIMEEVRHTCDRRVQEVGSPGVAVDVTRLQPQEIVLLSRVATSSQTDEFPALDRCAEDFWRQLEELPRIGLVFAREVCRVFATSPFPIDRLNLAQLLRPLTVVDHDTGFALWHQLVRDENPNVRREIYQQVHECLSRPHDVRDVDLADLGLTLADAHELRDAFVSAQLGENLNVVEQSALGRAMREATTSFASLATID